MSKLTIEANSPAELLALGRSLFTGAVYEAPEQTLSYEPAIPITGSASRIATAEEAPKTEPDKKPRSKTAKETSAPETPVVDFAAKLAEQQETKAPEQATPAPVAETPAPTAKADLEAIRKAYGPKWTNPATKDKVIALIGEYGHTKLGEFYENASATQTHEFYQRLLAIS